MDTVYGTSKNNEITDIKKKIKKRAKFVIDLGFRPIIFNND